MPPTAEEIMAVLRARAFRRLVEAAHVAGDFMCEVLKGVVSGPSPGHRPGPASITPFLYAEPSGRMRRRPEQWKKAPSRVRGGPPGLGAGEEHGRDTIKYQIKEQDLVAGRIVLSIGVDASRPGGTTVLRSYLAAHDMGIRYPTRPKRDGTGAPARVIQHPWFRVTMYRYRNPMAQIIVGVSRGLM